MPPPAEIAGPLQKLLRRLVRWSDRIRWTESQPGNGRALLQQACREGSEGIIAKHLGSPYIQSRSPWWVKIKCVGRQEFAVGGWTDPQRSRVGLGALLVGYYEDDRLLYAGKVGTGYTREVLLQLREQLGRLEQSTSPFQRGEPPPGRGVHWVRPRLVAEIAFGEWTQHGLLRQPRASNASRGLGTARRPCRCRLALSGREATPGTRAARQEEDGRSRRRRRPATRLAVDRAALPRPREPAAERGRL